eukprot:CAMPEP_0172879512 /NCGR_PEP_ID=MMETSP1075-20121228/112646_1 /TAXON_ID=2916 /ORGANISM="Ceratium fusus, Strain PA161109" /LENGTH=50 /DNA_ID=CAMNT_0013731523 /DNA_START=26 /DNA_END=178 /DNA_ORIENTATION=-
MKLRKALKPVCILATARHSTTSLTLFWYCKVSWIATCTIGKLAMKLLAFL